jgi:acetyl esterase
VNALVFSVDYPLAPSSKYPELIEYCMKAYLYIKNLLDKVLELEDYQITLTGDSAGGNICFAVLNWILMNNLQVPKGLLLCYPVVYVNTDMFTPSLLNTLHDYILNFNMLNLCNKCYLNDDCNPQEDFMLRYTPNSSPLVTPSSLLKQFPRIDLFICEKDPLHDDAIRLFSRLKEFDISSNCLVFKNLPHGLLSMDMPNGLTMAASFVIKTIHYMINIFEEK